MLNFGDAADPPRNSQIRLFPLPVLKKDDGPERATDGVKDRELAQYQPSRKAYRSREYLEAKVILEKGKIKRNVLAKLVSNVVQIGLVQDILLAPFVQPLLVESIVMKREDGLDIFPLSLSLGDSRAPFISSLGNQQVYQPQPLGFGNRLITDCL